MIGYAVIRLIKKTVLLQFFYFTDFINHIKISVKYNITQYIGKLINNKSVTKDFLSGTRENIPPEEWYIHNRPEYILVSAENSQAAAGVYVFDKTISLTIILHISANIIYCFVVYIRL